MKYSKYKMIAWNSTAKTHYIHNFNNTFELISYYIFIVTKIKTFCVLNVQENYKFGN